MAFFDGWAHRYAQTLAPFPSSVLNRYLDAPRRRFNKEYRFRALGDLRELEVLDLGCGEGENSILLAKAGATVTGMDISPASVELCRRRAELNGVAASTRFIQSPLELVEFEPATFDIVWGDGILHHVIDELDLLLPRVRSWAKPGGRIMFSEPVARLAWFRKLRLGIPIHTDATPDERPLGPIELEKLQKHLPGGTVRPFLFLSRLAEFLLRNKTYEEGGRLRRALFDAIYGLDYLVLSLPVVSSFAAMEVYSAQRA